MRIRLSAAAFLLPALVQAVELSPGLSLQYDAVRADHEDDSAQSADEFRRTRLSLRGKAGERFGFKLEYDAKPDAWTDAYAEWVGDRLTWRVGQHKTPFGLEQLNSDRGWMFMESAASDLLTIGRRLGVAVEVPLAAGRLQATAFDQDLRGRNGGAGLALRGVWTPIVGEERALHLGAAAAYQRSRDGRHSLNPHAESVILPFRPLGTGTIDAVDAAARLGLEAAWIQGSWTVQSEWLGLELDRSGFEDAGAHGGYVSVSRVLTGESRGYKAGALSAPKPVSRYGALEVAARAGRLRVDDANASTDDRLNTFTLGFNWYLAYEIRLMLNATYAETGAGDDLRLIATRLQIAF